MTTKNKKSRKTAIEIRDSIGPKVFRPAPTRVIAAIRDSFVGAETVYTKGSCVQFHLILKSIFPDALAYWSIIDEHCISKIGNRFYDINGIFAVGGTDYQPLIPVKGGYHTSLVQMNEFETLRMVVSLNCPRPGIIRIKR